MKSKYWKMITYKIENKEPEYLGVINGEMYCYNALISVGSGVKVTQFYYEKDVGVLDTGNEWTVKRYFDNISFLEFAKMKGRTLAVLVPRTLLHDYGFRRGNTLWKAK